MPPELTLRPAAPGDLPAIADLYLRVRAAAVPAMPPPVRPAAETRSWVLGWDLDERDAWVAEAGPLVGFMVLTPTWLDMLYVEQSAQQEGVGTALLGVAKELRPDGFGLWVFETNGPALAFYRRHGLVELEHTDGSENEESAPDIAMAWPGDQPLVFLRGKIDEVDHQLAQLLARRVALTAAVQTRKPVGGPAGRDSARERQIAERMAVHAPVLGVDRLAHIIDVIITESLEATS